MRSSRISLLLAMVVGACGPAGAPLPDELAGDEAARLFSVTDNEDSGNHYGQEKNGNDGDNGNHHGWYKDDGNGRCHLSDDPLADQMPYRKIDQGFEEEPLGALAALYRWIDAPGGAAVVTDELAFAGQKSLKLTTAPSTTTQTSGVRFCVACEAMEHFKASFAIRFESFISWNGLMVTNNPRLAYWWWVRANGTVFDDPASTAATLQARTWHQVEIEIDRKKGEAHLIVDGSEYVVPLLGTWYDGAHDQPMGCFRLLTLAPAKASQTIHVDNIKVHAIE